LRLENAICHWLLASLDQVKAWQDQRDQVAKN